jgi:hypothetical protein
MDVKTLPLKPNGHVLAHEAEVTVFEVGDQTFPLVTGIMFNCALCDGQPTYRITADAVHVQDPCPYPDGITAVSTLPVPSGQLLVTDDLRPVYDWDSATTASLNSALGKVQAARAMAELGCAFGSTRNCGLGLYPTSTGYVIATPRYTEDEHPTYPDSASLADIVTNLWAYCLVDLEAWKTRGGNPETLDWADTIVDVPPGTYQVTYHGGERGFDPDSPDDVIWAHIQRAT